MSAAGASGQQILEWQDPEAIAHAAEAFLESKLGQRDGNTTIRAGMLDRRLRLAACDAPLESFLRPGTRIGARTTIGVRCTGTRSWKVYVPVEVAVRRTVWVARHALPRGHLLTAADLVADERDIARTTASYVTDRDVLIGQRLKSSILAGRALTRQLIEADVMVQHGQRVTLGVLSGNITIRMAGKALADGAVNQRIRVENLNSGRVVEGIVRTRELVEVLVPVTADIRSEAPKESPSVADTGISNNDR